MARAGNYSKESGEEATPAKSDSIVDEAKSRFERAKSFYGPLRMQAIEDTRFVMGDSDNMWQWPEEISRKRKLDKKVRLTINTTAQHCNQIINGIRANRPAVKVSPVDNRADKKTAEILAGLIRNIQVSSNAEDSHDCAAEHAIYGGEGYWRIVTEYEDEASFNQVLCIKPCQNPQLVYIDPDTKEIDKSDAKWGFVFEDITRDEFERDYPGIDPSSWATDSCKNGWAEGEKFRVADYYYCTYEQDTAVMLMDGRAMLKSQMQPGDIVAIDQKTGKPMERDTQISKWKWCKLVGGHDKPASEVDWLGDFLPIISVVGKEVNVNGELVRKGQVRDLKDPARMLNYAYSETVQTLALQNKVPYTAPAEAIEGHEQQWNSANVENRSVLLYNHTDQSGQPIPAPQRQLPAVMPAAQIELLHLSSEQMRAASGQQNANFGIKSEAQSGVGIQRLKAQGEIATFHFPDNLARALRLEAKILINLIQKYYDTARVVRILGLDGKEAHAKLDPAMEGPYFEAKDEAGEIEKIFNPLVGKYDVTIDTGPSYQTLRQEAAANLNELAAKQPQVMGIAGDLIMRAQDFPMADQMAERFAKTLPPELRDEEEGEMQIPPQVQHQMAQMQEQMQMMQQALQEAQSGQQAKMQQTQTDAEVKVLQSRKDAETEMQKAQIDAQVQLQKAQIEAETKKQIAMLQIESDQEIERMRSVVSITTHTPEQPDPYSIEE